MAQKNDKEENGEDHHELLKFCKKQKSYNAKCNPFLLYNEKLNRDDLLTHSDDKPGLYPTLNDPNFNNKIAQIEEFADNKYDGTIHDVKKHANELIDSGFDISPHQILIRNFLSMQTPFNSLLLFHGLGSGKTCSAIGVCEEMRDYLKQIGRTKQIIVIANPNVQDNFKHQLFNPKMIENIDGVWIIKETGCVGNKFLNELNPTHIKNISREKVIYQVNSLINTYYDFMGYGQFANTLEHIIEHPDLTSTEKIKMLQDKYSNTLIIIDEVHNIRISTSSSQPIKNIYKYLSFMTSVVSKMKMLLMSATPMFDSYTEIISLLNIMNLNDNRGIVSISDIFNSDGTFLTDKDNNPIGEDLFIRKITGYISYVRGENPYMFPYRVYPSLFAPKKRIANYTYPSHQINGEPIKNKISQLDLFIVHMNKYQKNGYDYISNYINNHHVKLGYAEMQIIIKGLTIIYPIDGLLDMKIVKTHSKINIDIDEESMPSDDDSYGDSDIASVNSLIEKTPNTKTDELNPDILVGSIGLSRLMDFTTAKRGDFSYKKHTLEKWGRFFDPENIGKYSIKIKTICEYITKSEGIILIYSNYIDGGLIPMALAIEEMGYTRFNGKNLFSDSLSRPNKKINGSVATYTMITGDTRLSPNNADIVSKMTMDDNIHGEKIKIVLISQAGSEGLDFKAIRQIHIMEPWYNINRIEQIIGRGVRHFSHKNLIFEHRNVQIFMYGTINKGSNEEMMDLYLYRLSEKKAIKIGKITRLLKENAIDCIINSEQYRFTNKRFAEIPDNKNITQILSDYTKLKHFKIGDCPNSSICDYMNTCIPYKKNTEQIQIKNYSEQFMQSNIEIIINKIKKLFLQNYFYKKKDLIQYINIHKKYPISQINQALNFILENNEYIIDKYNQMGKLVNIGEYYLFQPESIPTDIPLSSYERSVPVSHISKFIKIEDTCDKKDDKTCHLDNINIMPNIKHNGKEIISNMELIMKNMSKILNPRDKTNYTWYDWANVVMKKMEKEYNVSQKILNNLLLDHIYDSIVMKDKIDLLNYMTIDDPDWSSCKISSKMSDIYNEMRKRLCNNIIHVNKITGIGLINSKNKMNIYVYSDTHTQWAPAESEDIYDITPQLNKIHQLDDKKLNKYIGFMGFDTNGSQMVFKAKDISSHRNTGFRCEQSGKAKLMEFMNNLEGDDSKYSKTKTKENIIELCVKCELIMRMHDNIKTKSSIWFISPETSILGF